MKVEYWLKGEEIQNFGDSITDLLLRDLFDIPCVEAYACRLIGSVIADFVVDSDLGAPDASPRKLIYWGCGLRSSTSLSLGQQKRCEFRCVRGPLTRSILGLEHNLPIGDPGFVLPAIYRPKQVQSVRGKVIYIPHFHDQRSHSDMLNQSGADGVIESRIRSGVDNIYRIVDCIASASFVLSSSLHGAIIAAAYRKRFCFFNAGVIDLPFKWEDLALSLNIKTSFARDIEEGRHIYDREIKNKIKLPDVGAMLRVAPFLVRPRLLAMIMGAVSEGAPTRNENSHLYQKRTPGR
jgi:Polysaccharide pyruvyl transferase